MSKKAVNGEACGQNVKTAHGPPGDTMSLRKASMHGPATPWRHQAGLLAFCLASTGIMGCRAPGMKLNTRPPQDGTVLKDAHVNLMAITPELVRGLNASSPSTTLPAELLSIKQEPYRVGPQDSLLPTVWDHPEITQPLGQYRSDPATGVIVDDKGEIYMPYVGPLPVAGMTTHEIRTILTDKLSAFIRRPQVDVKVLAFRSKKIYVSGEVKNPSMCNITDVPMTLADAIHQAGGLLPSADDSIIRLTRGSRTWTLDYHAALASGSGLGRIILKDGDSLFVPNRQDEPVYMLGELARPGITPRHHGRLSLARAITDTGGISGTNSDARSIYVIRQAARSGEVDVFHLDARNPTSMVLADSFPLRARDVVYVDAGTLVRFSRVMSLVLPTVQAINATAISGAEVRYLRNSYR